MTLPNLGLFLVGICAWLVLRTAYRLCLHPLSHIPGPYFAAATHFYEFFYNVLRPGMFLFKVEEMHKRYGPIVRINSREVHVCDPAFYDEIYASSSRRRDKDACFVPTLGMPDSVVATVDHDYHRHRRAIIADFFSRRSVLELSAVLDERVQMLMQRLGDYRRDQSVICLDDAFGALTADVITHFTCGRHWGFLEDASFRNEVRQAAADAIIFSHINRFAPWLVSVTRVLLLRTLSSVMPGKAAFFDFLSSFLDYASSSPCFDDADYERHVTKRQEFIIDTLTHPSIQSRERSPLRLRDEMCAIITAGTETTARTLTVAAYHLARNGAARDLLCDELKQVLPTSSSKPTWPQLEKLPYLTAVVHESLRLSYGVTGRLPRVAPTESLYYKSYVIPPGTPVSSSSYFTCIHRDESIFPDPDRFDPDRWIKAAQDGNYLKRYLVAFTKGIRSCIGINLAMMELFLTIAHLGRWFHFHLVDTAPEDVRIVRDMMIGYTRRGPFKVYATVSSANGHCRNETAEAKEVVDPRS